MNIDWRRKLTSRKLWLAVGAFVSGLIMAFGGSESVAQMVSGVILQGAAVLGYLLAEGLTDASNGSIDPDVHPTGRVFPMRWWRRWRWGFRRWLRIA